MLLYQKWNVTVLGQKNQGGPEKVKIVAVIQVLTIFAHIDVCKDRELQSWVCGSHLNFSHTLLPSLQKENRKKVEGRITILANK